MPITIACIGLAQVVLQVVILFGFQVLHGVVVAEVSLVVTVFLAGLALGGTASNRWLPRRAGSHPEGQHVNIKRLLLGDLIAIMAYNLVVPLILRSPIPAPELVFPLLAGSLTSVAFPLKAREVSYPTIVNPNPGGLGQRRKNCSI